MAFGTKTIRSVAKVFGPGNAYVVAAKRLLFGRVGVDLLPGPSEVLVLADDSAKPSFVAADLLAQAEHGSGHERVWLVTPSAKLIAAVQQEIERQLATLSRRDFVERALAGAVDGGRGGHEHPGPLAGGTQRVEQPDTDFWPLPQEPAGIAPSRTRPMRWRLPAAG